MNDLVHYWLGARVLDMHCLIAMSSPMSPKPNDTLAPEWQNVSTGVKVCILLIPCAYSLPSPDLIRAVPRTQLYESGGR